MPMSEPASRISYAPSAILPLPADAIAQIKSSHTITSLNGVVLGLLENALDAQAIKIEITIDAQRGGCTIEDNGIGISPNEFRDGGGLGRMHHTSKRSNSETGSDIHGNTGTFLASIAALSLVTITSRHIEHFSHNTLAFHRTKPIVRLTPAPALHHIHGSPHGTRITVRDLFGGMPVRVKQRAQAADDQHEAERNWQTIKKGISSLLLPWRRSVTIKVCDAHDRTRSLSISCNNAPSLNPLSEENVNALEVRKAGLGFDPSGVLNILNQTGYSPPECRDSWIPACAATDYLSVRGVICLEPAPTRAVQFMSIGTMPCSDETGHHDLYDAVNRVFSNSSFGCTEDDPEPDGKERKRRMGDRRYKHDGPTEKQRKGGGRGVDRWPRFFLHIEPMDRMRSQDVHRGYTDSGMQEVIDIVQALAVQWLEANHFRPRNRHRKKQRDHDHTPASDLPRVTTYEPSRPRLNGSSTRKSSCSQALIQPLGSMRPSRGLQSPFAEWSRIKSGKIDQYQDLWKCTSIATNGGMKAQSQSPVINVRALSAGELGSGSVMPTPHKEAHPVSSLQHEPSLAVADHATSESTNEEDLMHWFDPVSNKRLCINTRTGMVVPDAHIGEGPRSSGPAAINTTLSSAGKPINLSRRQTAPIERPAPWLMSLLQGWDIPIFANQTEQAIPVAAYDYGDVNHSCGDHQIDQAFLQADLGSSERLLKGDLLHAEVVSQVDHKFILLKLKSSDGENNDLLVLVDQHAASERCILEELLAELCTPNSDPHPVKSNAGLTSHIRTCNLESPLCFQVSKVEGTLFDMHAAYFARWGILYNSRERRSIKDRNDVRLDVLTLPPGISERCKAEPKHLIELLRTEIHSLADRSRTRTAGAMECLDGAKDSQTWLKQIGSCPNGIIKMLNSRACRSAIMFNDKLSTMECRELVQKLAACAFPFMCAHGRVSMVPLVCLGDGDGGMLGSSVFQRAKKPKERSFAEAFKQWRRKA